MANDIRAGLGLDIISVCREASNTPWITRLAGTGLRFFRLDLHHLKENGIIPCHRQQVGFLKAPKILIRKIYYSADHPPTDYLQKWFATGYSHTVIYFTKNGGGAKPYDLKVSFKPINPDGAPNVYRRSMYTYWKSWTDSVMMALDASKKCLYRKKRKDWLTFPIINIVKRHAVCKAARAFADHWLSNMVPKILSLVNYAFQRSRYPKEKRQSFCSSFSVNKKQFKMRKRQKNSLRLGTTRIFPTWRQWALLFPHLWISTRPLPKISTFMNSNTIVTYGTIGIDRNFLQKFGGGLGGHCTPDMLHAEDQVVSASFKAKRVIYPFNRRSIPDNLLIC